MLNQANTGSAIVNPFMYPRIGPIAHTIPLYQVKFGQKAYWIAQITGWSTFVLGNDLIHLVSGTFVPELVFSSLLTLFCGIAVTHSFRMVVHKLGWNDLRVGQLVPRVLLATVIMSVIYLLLFGAISDLLIPNTEAILVWHAGLLIYLANFGALLFIWNILYFAIHFFRNFRAAEIKNLELKASKTEMELSSFKSQLNPHFMFNSMNSIRALVDENPARAKEAITLLSAILRTTLKFGKKDLVPLTEELDLVKSYLSMEKIRFEERLQVEYDLDIRAMDALVPPFTVQTIVENAVKHGIANLKQGGKVRVTVTMLNHNVKIKVVNSGELKLNGHGTGIGLNNTRKRLELLFGENASFGIGNIKEGVEAVIDLPITRKYNESNNN